MFYHDKWNAHVRAMLDHARTLEEMAARANDKHRLALLRTAWAVRDRLSEARLDRAPPVTVEEDLTAVK